MAAQIELQVLNLNAEFLMQVVDLIIFVSSLCIICMIVCTGTLSQSVAPTLGRTMLFVGILLAVIVVGVDQVLLVLDTSNSDQRMPHGGDSLVPYWVHWFLSRSAFALVAFGTLIALLHRKKFESAYLASAARVRLAESNLSQSEDRFESVLDTTTNAVYCYEFDPPMPISVSVDEQIKRSHGAILIWCNKAFARELEAISPAEVVGNKMALLDSNNDDEAHSRYFRSFVENNYRISDYELIYKNRNAEECALRVSLSGEIKDGCLYRMWGSETNILDLRQTRSALNSRLRYQQLVSDISAKLLKSTNEDVDSVLRNCLQMICKSVSADRSTLIWLDPQTNVALMEYYWNEVDVAPSRVVSMEKFPKLAECARNGEVIRIDDVRELPRSYTRDRQSLSEIGVKSFTVLPLLVADEVVGAATFSNFSECRRWTDQDILELRVFSDLFANFILRLKSYRDLDQALDGLRNATDRLEAENIYLRQEIESSHGFDEIVGQSAVLMQCLQMVEQVADTATPVLISGETGTGKELIARAIHERSGRRDRPLVKVNCAALPGDLIESELFGYEAGAFTDAKVAKRGRFDLADNGTLFLDEIGELPVGVQAKLLRVLQEGQFERLGGDRTTHVDVRIIAATNRDLSQAIEAGEFRSDMYYRISTFPIDLPALRDRGDDIRLLTEHFARIHAQRLGRDIGAISASMMQQINDYPWPGNIRELEGVIQRAIISTTGPVLELAEPLIVSRSPSQDVSRFGNRSELPRVISSSVSNLHSVERDHIISTLEETGWKISGKLGAATKLGLPASTLRSKMKKLQIFRP